MFRSKLKKNETIKSISPHYHGMPPLDQNGKVLSWFEFMPSSFFYTPVVFFWLWLGIKYRNFSLPLIANPAISLSGIVGESKDSILSLAGEKAASWILPYIMWQKENTPIKSQVTDILAKLQEANLNFPIVAKPDVGCRGAGVRLLKNEKQLESYVDLFPLNAQFLLQKKALYEAEAGVFYVRYPNQTQGEIISLTLKYTPYVIGDGKHTLAQLIDNDPRAGKLSHLYRSRHQDLLDKVIDKGFIFHLVFSGSHCQGAIFKDGNQYITKALTARLDEIFNDLPRFHYGRIDLKFKNIESLMNGQDFVLLEINGASSEAAHIWDSNGTIKEAFSTLLKQYRILFEIGAMNRDAGIPVPRLTQLWRAWRKEKNLVDHYPSTD